MARSAPAPVGSGDVMWKASLPMAAPPISQYTVAPRSSARSSGSSTIIAAPSLGTKPVRCRSNGREIVAGSPVAVDSAPAFDSEATSGAVRAASVAPASTTSTSPRRSR